MDSKKLGEKLSKIVSGDVFSDKEILDYYSVDSSSYQIRPKFVVIPKKRRDIVNVVKFSRKTKIPITVRGAGTGLVGGAIGDGIILDLKHFDSIKISKNNVTIGPGVLKGKLDILLKTSKKFLGPNPSVGPYCTFGGMIGTNASGSRSLKYGAIIDNLLQITIITGTGEIITLPSDEKFSKLIFKISKKIGKKNYPKVTKNSCGYRLDAVTTVKNSHKVMAGSEGTLGIIISAKLKTREIPTDRRLMVLAYNSEIVAAKDCFSINKLNPSALEIVDAQTIKNINYEFPKKTKCLLLVEFDSDLKNSALKLKRMVYGDLLLDIKKEDEIERWWKYRNSALYYSLRSISKKERAPHVIEDATVPVNRLEDLISLINRLRRIPKCRVIVYGHAGNGNLHVRMISEKFTKKLILKISKDYFSKVIKIGGTITGEHGDGLSRSEFVKLQYSPKTYKEFQNLKKLFDPENVLNPGKIITHKSTIIENIDLKE